MIMRSDGTITKAYDVEKEAEARGFQRAIKMLESEEAQKFLQLSARTMDSTLDLSRWLSAKNPYKDGDK